MVVRPPPFWVASSLLVGGAAWLDPTFLSFFGVVLLASPPLGGVALFLSLVGGAAVHLFSDLNLTEILLLICTKSGCATR